MTNRTQTILLASASPRRRELLHSAGFRFTVIPAPVDETHDGREQPTVLVERLALEKAEAGARWAARQHEQPTENSVVLGADTLVTLENQILGKPASPAEARQMLTQLAGQEHQVHTGVALVSPLVATEDIPARRLVAHETTRVFFRPLTKTEIATYVATGEPLDKAGAYAIQGYAARFVRRLEGCYFNVMGLPIALVDRLLHTWEDQGTTTANRET